MIKLLSRTLLLLVVLSSKTLAGNPDAILGDWIVEDNNSKVTITKVDGKYEGKITWIRTTGSENSDTKLDSKNEQSTLRSRKLMGLIVIKDMTYNASADCWQGGTIYAYDDGKEYECKMWIKNGALIVRGFVKVSILGSNQVWTRPK